MGAREGVVTGFWAVAKAGKELADLHIGYDKLERYPLKFVETGEALGVRELAPAFAAPKRASANKAAPGRRTPKGAPRAPLPVPLSYRVEDKHSGIRSDPKRPDDPEYIVRLVGQVIGVSLETVRVVKSWPTLAAGSNGQ